MKMLLPNVSITCCLMILALTGLHLTSAQSRCYNPNRRNGVCISIYDCPSLINVLSKTPLPAEDRRFLLESRCNGGAGRQPHVCCNEDIGFVQVTTSPPPTPRPSVSISPSNGRGNVLPNPPVCGREPLNNKIYNGHDTGIDEFPWMALIQYRQSNGKPILNCGASLINERYVITAAHCVTGDVLKQVGSLDMIRLGEYDISQKIDCVDTDCNDDGILEVPIEEIIAHEGFSSAEQSRHHDIALIRLARDVPYSDFIAPICMPFTVSAQRAQPGVNLTVAGWGRTLLSRQSQVKQKLQIPVWDQNECSQQFKTKNVNLIDSQLCAGGRFAEDSCDGDSGGPLMKYTGRSWILEGIVSFGNRCGLENWPAVYTRVASYEDWIRNNMKP